MTGQLPLTAHCTCRQQSIQLAALPVAQLVCHCSDCQQATQRPSTPIAFFMPDACQVTGTFTENTMAGHSGHSKTYFSCPECNSCLYATVSVLKGMVGVVADTVDAPFEFAPSFHVWTSEKHASTQLNDKAPQFANGPPKPPQFM